MEISGDAVLEAAIALDSSVAKTREERIEFSLQHLDECVGSQ